MSEIKDRIKALLIKYLQEELTPEEDRELEDWITMSEENRLLFNRLADKDQLQTEMQELHMAGENIRRKIDARLGVQIGTLKDPVPGRLVSMPPSQSRQRNWLYAAASLLVLLAGAAYFGAGHFSKAGNMDTAGHTAAQQDVAPGGNKAILTLADGSTLVLDSANTGEVGRQGSSKVLKLDSGRLAYQTLLAVNDQPGTRNSQPVTFNTLTTPRAGQFEVKLPDGTRVWLNNASSLRYPTSFAGAERSVELTGEGYFEIAPDAARPFTVKVNGLSVEVLGTRFNILSYTDEDAIRTTLLEGKVKVSGHNKELLLKPGEQAAVGYDGSWQLVKGVDADEIIDWKNGFFHFTHESLPAVMRQLARWYDVGVEYRGTIPAQYYQGDIHRDLTLSQVLDNLGGKDVHFHIEDRKVIVTP